MDTHRKPAAGTCRRILDAAVLLASMLSLAIFHGCGKKERPPGGQVMCYEPASLPSEPAASSVELLELKLGVLENQIKERGLDLEAARKALPAIAAEIEKLSKESSGADAEKLDALSERAKKLATELE